MYWQQVPDQNSFRLYGEHPDTFIEYNALFENTVRWCVDNFEPETWSRSQLGSWKIHFVSSDNATLFKIRWC